MGGDKGRTRLLSQLFLSLCHLPRHRAGWAGASSAYVGTPTAAMDFSGPPELQAGPTTRCFSSFLHAAWGCRRPPVLLHSTGAQPRLQNVPATSISARKGLLDPRLPKDIPANERPPTPPSRAFPVKKV